jgi:hypothetical protein
VWQVIAKLKETEATCWPDEQEADSGGGRNSTAAGAGAALARLAPLMSEK